MIRQQRSMAGSGSHSKAPLKLVVVCKGDVAAEHMVAHIPIMCALAGVSMCALQKGAETQISHALFQRRAVVVGLEEHCAEFEAVFDLVREHAMPLGIPWATDALNGHQGVYQSMQTKQIHTTAPIRTKKSTTKRKPPVEDGHDHAAVQSKKKLQAG